ncbi:MAG TPA: hypothetical protein VG276_28065 [Actinomycetes bacterium]|nr:hypothetical protein [Actinomycetes bacterium]
MSDGVFWPELEAWLLEHGIRVADCYQVAIRWTVDSVHGGPTWNGPVRMQVDLWRNNEQGLRYVGQDGEIASETLMIPMRRLPAVEVVRYRPEAPR